MFVGHVIGHRALQLHLGLGVQFDGLPLLVVRFHDDPGQAHIDRLVQVDLAVLIGADDRLRRLEVLALLHRRRLPALLGHVVTPQHDVIHRVGDRLAVGGLEQVHRRDHQQPRLRLGVCRQWHMHRHLVAVEVRVESLAHQRMKLNRLAVDQHRLEGLDAQPVQGRGAVEQHHLVLDDHLQRIPHHRINSIHHPLGGLDVGGVPLFDQLVHHKGLEQLQRHLAR